MIKVFILVRVAADSYKLFFCPEYSTHILLNLPKIMHFFVLTIESTFLIQVIYLMK